MLLGQKRYNYSRELPLGQSYRWDINQHLGSSVQLAGTIATACIVSTGGYSVRGSEVRLCGSTQLQLLEAALVLGPV